MSGAGRSATGTLAMRRLLAGMLVATLVLTFCVAVPALLVWRLPLIARDTQDMLQQDVGVIAQRLRNLMRLRETRLGELADTVHGKPAALAAQELDEFSQGDDLVDSALLISAEGRVLAAGVSGAGTAVRDALLGRNVATTAIIGAARMADKPVWSGVYASFVNGRPTVAVALRDGLGQVLVGEMPLAMMGDVLEIAGMRRGDSVVVLDRDGVPVAMVGEDRQLQPALLRGVAMAMAQPGGQAAVASRMFGRQNLHAAATRMDGLGWTVLSFDPAGWNNPRVRDLLVSSAGLLAASLLVAVLIAPLWANLLARPLRRLADRALHGTAGRAAAIPWPRSRVAEIDTVSQHLQAMDDTLRLRERKLSAIFNAAPVPMVVIDLGNGERIQDANEAWCEERAQRREDILGRTLVELGMWNAPEDYVAAKADAQGAGGSDITLLDADGQPLLLQTHARSIALGSERLLIIGSIDIGPLRRAQDGLRELNAALEERVAQRTQALAASNNELSQALERLKLAQATLVQSEKMAALGGLVAGVAHELNTPLGNGVMAVSAMTDATRRFKGQMAGGLRRTDLQTWVESLEQGMDITGRNLRRSADLVQNFKQVAVDQTSAQRRRFQLYEVVHEMVVSLQPTFARSPYRIVVEVPATGLAMDSYAGALSQTVGNLIQNAMLHAFEGLDHGAVTISGEADADGTIVLRVADDGRGVPANVIGRIFEPFVTTRMGRGGTGLGLHISYNAVVHVLGGTLTVASEEGQGACFELRLPAVAPKPSAQSAGVASAGAA